MTSPAIHDVDVHPIHPAPRFPPLEWRWPMTLWIGVSLILAIGWPLAVLRPGFGVGLAIAAVVALTCASALTALGGMMAAGAAPRARRDVVLITLGFGALFSLATPIAAGIFSGAIGTPGFTWGMAAGLWPLALTIGLPGALFAGLVLAFIAFRKPEQSEPDVLIARPGAEPAGGAMVPMGQSRDVNPFH